MSQQMYESMLIETIRGIKPTVSLITDDADNMSYAMNLDYGNVDCYGLDDRRIEEMLKNLFEGLTYVQVDWANFAQEKSSLRHIYAHSVVYMRREV